MYDCAYIRVPNKEGRQEEVWSVREHCLFSSSLSHEGLKYTILKSLCSYNDFLRVSDYILSQRS